jgi:predicted dehydrogenase
MRVEVAEQERLRVGIIGTGRIASTIQDEVETGPWGFLLPYSHAGAYAANPETTIVAAADTNQSRLEEFAARWHVPHTFQDYREMLRQEPLDIVSVCTPTRTHAEIVAEIARSGVRGLYLEKPIAQSLREADAMIEALDAANITTVVNHNRTFDPYYRRVQWLIEQGRIGDVHGILIRWREGMSFGGSHLFDLVRFLLGSEVAWVYGRLDSGDGLFDRGGIGLVGFHNGVDVLVDNRAGHAAPRELDIAGSKGRIRIGDALYPELYTVDEASPTRELVRRIFPGAVVGDSPMKVAVRELIEALRDGKTPLSTIRDGRANLEIAVAFHLSDRSGTRVDLPVNDLDLVVEDPWGRS